MIEAVCKKAKVKQMKRVYFWTYWVREMFKVKLNSKAVGVFGEAAGARYLRKNKKLKILERN